MQFYINGIHKELFVLSMHCDKLEGSRIIDLKSTYLWKIGSSYNALLIMSLSCCNFYTSWIFLVLLWTVFMNWWVFWVYCCGIWSEGLPYCRWIREIIRFWVVGNYCISVSFFTGISDFIRYFVCPEKETHWELYYIIPSWTIYGYIHK